jgi:hypothetical protein
MALCYLRRLRATCPWARGVPDEDFLVALEASRLLLCVQWLGWAQKWSPPRAHARDWIEVAKATMPLLDPAR